MRGIKIYRGGVFLSGGKIIEEGMPEAISLRKDVHARGTMAYSIMQAHNTSGDCENLKIRFDALASHDITYVGIVQTARASGLEKFPLPYVLTNCHNSLCAVGGTINEDDHAFGLTSAQKYGGIYVPAHLAVIHQYVREMMAGCGRMILGSDSHTRYGALGTLGVGEGGGELAKQLLGKTYDLRRPEVTGVYLTGKPQEGVGPQDVALAIIGAVFKSGYVKNKVMEFVGDGIGNLSTEYRMGIDVMTTETACLSSIWETDEIVSQYLKDHGRPGDYAPLRPDETAFYDGMIYVDLSEIRPMIALPFHPSNVYEIEELNKNLEDILSETEKEGAKILGTEKVRFSLADKVEDGALNVQQAVIAGCAGGMFENICAAADILEGKYVGSGRLALSIYPASQPIFMQTLRNGVTEKLALSGATIRTAFCGPCFGAGDVPSNNDLSIRHTTRNFPNREGSKLNEGQIASVALMDARSIAATVRNGGRLTPATELEDIRYSRPVYFFDKTVYDARVYNGWGSAVPERELKRGPGIADWPEMTPLTDDIILKVVSVILDPVTTTDELIPSGETSSYRSNPLKLAEFTLSRKDPDYVGRAKSIQMCENARLKGKDPSGTDAGLAGAYKKFAGLFSFDAAKTGIGSVIYAVKPGDGSAREQAASSQKVLGGLANIALEYATKRYRSNLINWGVLPFVYEGSPGSLPFKNGDYLFIRGIRKAITDKDENIRIFIYTPDRPDESVKEISTGLGALTDDERKILLAGSLINFYKSAL